MNLLNHDDFSWLVYADWLEERGNILSDHIRFQVEEDEEAWNYEYYLRSRSVGINFGVGGIFSALGGGGSGSGDVGGGCGSGDVGGGCGGWVNFMSSNVGGSVGSDFGGFGGRTN